MRTYVLRRGFLDGRAGFMIAVFNAETVYYRFLKLGHERQRPPGSRPGVTMPGCPRRACPPDRRRHAPPATTTESDRHVLHHHSGWNNLPYLKLVVDSLRRHSAYDHQIIVHVNDGSDGTLDWVRSEGSSTPRRRPTSASATR